MYMYAVLVCKETAGNTEARAKAVLLARHAQTCRPDLWDSCDGPYKLMVKLVACRNWS